ncbi:GNAT family N-acetyltransferase [Streptomyces johnsoniae]|uniref:GNAT family N-acetyltransferase n=1 Tax=Streptomyces johnsoniae TaxID=3075532 RepID=A0ABU2SBN0_9ACTN|nr:GNAT family N-acetyltransferase [Streptomyces sp. DSM 41886]MDT0446302.1 GNAT family N-acetyltransferase [Streptomyces sp. DSM 41886]
MGTTAELSFRTASEADVPAVVTLVESAYRGERSRAGWTTEADLLDGRRTGPDEVGAALADPAGRLLLAERDAELVACCRLVREAGRAGEPAAHFGMFAVRPDLQAAGVGRLMLAEAERVVREEWGARHLEMQVLTPRTSLIAWYERRGYVRTGRTVPFPYGDERFGVPRMAGLAFEVLVKRLP